MLTKVQIRRWEALPGFSDLENRSRCNRPLSFEQARDIVRAQNFTSFKKFQAWARPLGIPSDPYHVYKSNGWAGCGDWIGTDPPCKSLPFEEAREFAQSLGLKRRSEWETYCKSGKRMAGIPSEPRSVYKGKGWAGYGDWLGTNIPTRRYRHCTKDDCVAELQRVGQELGRTPIGSDFGKTGIGGMGTMTIIKLFGSWSSAVQAAGFQSVKRWSGGQITFLPFAQARWIVHSLKLKSKTQWFKWARNRPAGMPSNPSKSYAGKGWVTWGDWLGTGTVCTREPSTNRT